MIQEQEPKPQAPMTDFAFAGHLRGFLEKARVATQVHISHLKLDGRTDPLASEVLPFLDKAENVIELRMRNEIANHPVWTNWASRIRGCGLMSVSAIMSRCDIKRLDTPSSMWAHLGFAPGQHRVKGEKLSFDLTGKVWSWRLADVFIKQGNAMKTIYDNRKEYETANVTRAGGRVIPAAKGKTVEPPNRTALEVHRRAMRYMIKVWLACLWLEWRKAEGLPITVTYAEAYPGTDGRIHHSWKPADLIDKD